MKELAMKFGGSAERTSQLAGLARAALREKRCGVCGRGAAVVDFSQGYETPVVRCDAHDRYPLSDRERASRELNTIEHELRRDFKTARRRPTKVTSAGTDSARARLAKAERDSELARLNKLARRA